MSKQIQQRLFKLNDHVKSDADLSIPQSTIPFLENYKQSYESLSVVRRFIAHQRSVLCPPASYDPNTRASFAVVDASAHIGFAALVLAKRGEDFHRVIACEGDREAYQAMEHNVEANMMTHLITPKHISFFDYFQHQYGDAQSKYAIVYWDLSIPITMNRTNESQSSNSSHKQLSLKLTSERTDYAFSEPITLEGQTFSFLSAMLAFMLNHPNHSVPMFGLVVDDSLDPATSLYPLARAHCCETQIIREKHQRKIIVIAGTSRKRVDESQSIKQTINPYGANSTVLLASSRRQLEYLYQSRNSSNDSHLYQRLKQIMASQLWGKLAAQTALWDEFNRYMASNSGDKLDDEVVYDHLRNYFFTSLLHRPDCADLKAKKDKDRARAGCTCSAGSSGGEEDGRANSRVKEIVDIVSSHRWHPKSGLSMPVKEVIDVGCSEGSITAAVGSGLQLPPERIHGCDVRELTNTQAFTFTLITDTTLPYDSNSYQLVLALMALHHIPTVEASIAEIFRVLRPGGILLIREHDLNIPTLAPLIDVMHGLYARTWNDPPEQPEFCDDYYAHYRSRQDWSNMMKRVGFVESSASPGLRPQPWDRRVPYNRQGIIKNPFQFYYCVFEKPVDPAMIEKPVDSAVNSKKRARPDEDSSHEGHPFKRVA